MRGCALLRVLHDMTTEDVESTEALVDDIIATATTPEQLSELEDLADYIGSRLRGARCRLRGNLGPAQAWENRATAAAARLTTS